MDFSSIVKQFDGGFDPTTGRRAGLGALPAGTYQFDVLDASPRVVKDNKALVAFGLQVVDGEHAGQVFEFAWFLTSQAAINGLGGVLARLGLNVHLADGRFSDQIPSLLEQLPGVRLLATVTKHKQPGFVPREFTNLFVQRRVYGAAAAGQGG